MKLKNPFECLSIRGQKRAFVILLILTLTVMLGLQVINSPLKNEMAPYGIISFEFVGHLYQAKNIVESWGQKGQVYAGLSLGLDYLFLVFYAGSIGLGCVLAGRSLSRRRELFSSVGINLAWGQICAALLDGVENYALIRVLIGSEQEVWPALARWCAIPKFLIVMSGLAYIIIGIIAVMVISAREREEPAA